MKNYTAMNSLIMIALLISLGSYGVSRTTLQEAVQKESVQRAIIDIAPKALTLTIDTSLWVMKQVQVLNRGGSALGISRVNSSCGCASATIMSNPVQPMEVGKLLVRINTQNMKDSVSTVEFTIESDASNSPFVYRVNVVNPNFTRKN